MDATRAYTTRRGDRAMHTHGSRRHARRHAACARAMRRGGGTRVSARTGCVPTHGARAHACCMLSMHDAKGAEGHGRARMPRAPARCVCANVPQAHSRSVGAVERCARAHTLGARS
eukprot:645948-Pleurochrysis_carterae.AAC.1